MEFFKIILLLSISITCSLSHRHKETQAVENPEGVFKVHHPITSKRKCSNGRICRRNMGQSNQQQCTCFPLNNNNVLVPEYIKSQAQGELKRTVIYIYTIGNKSIQYIPNEKKQPLYIDLTFDEGDDFKPISAHYMNMLTAPEYGSYSPTSEGKDEDETRRANVLESEDKNQPIVIQDLEKLPLSVSKDINEEALKDILKDDLNGLVPNKHPNPQSGNQKVSRPHSIGESEPVFPFEPKENEYAQLDDQPIIVSKPGVNDKLVLEAVGSQEDSDSYSNEKKNPLHPIAIKPSDLEFDENNYESYPNQNNLYTQQVNKPESVIIPYDITGPNFENNEPNPNEIEIEFPFKGFGLNDEDQKLYAELPDALKPIATDENIDNIDRSVIIPGLNPNNNELHLHHINIPLHGLGSRPNNEDMNVYDSAHRDFGLSPDKDYAEPLSDSGLLANDNGPQYIAKPQTIFEFSPNNEYNVPSIVEPHKDLGFGSLLNSIPVNNLGLTPSEKYFYSNDIAHPQRKAEPQIAEGDEVSAGVSKPQPNMRCSSGMCKLYIYCSRYDCPKYLQSLAKLHTTIHRHPYLENTFVAMNNFRNNVNSTDSYLKPSLNIIGLEDADESVQNVRGVKLGNQHSNLHKHGHLHHKEESEPIPISVNPLRVTPDQGQYIHSIPSPIQVPQVGYYPRKNQIVSTQYRNPSYYRDLYIPRPIKNQYYGRRRALGPKSKGNLLKDLILLPSEIHRKGAETLSDIITNLSLRKDNVEDKEGASEESEVPVNEDDIGIRIIGGQPAVSSGTPMQIKARLGDV